MHGADLHPEEITEEAPALSPEVGDWFVSGRIAAMCSEHLDETHRLLVSVQARLSGSARAMRSATSPGQEEPGLKSAGAALVV